MSFRPQDATLVLRDGELAVLADGTQFRCVLEYPEDVNLFGGQSQTGQIVAKPSIVYATAEPGRELQHGDVLVIEDVSYSVRSARKLQDGAMSLAELKVGS